MKVIMFTVGEYASYEVQGLYIAPDNFDFDEAEEEYHRFLLSPEADEMYKEFSKWQNYSREEWAHVFSRPFSGGKKRIEWMVKYYNLEPLEYKELWF